MVYLRMTRALLAQQRRAFVFRQIRRLLMLANGGQPPAQGCRRAGLDQRRCAEINVIDMREYADDHYQDRT